jgi:hypothetical protein
LVFESLGPLVPWSSGPLVLPSFGDSGGCLKTILNKT